MDQDAALRKALESRGNQELSYGFEMTTMKQIMREAEAEKRFSSLRWIGLVSVVSAVMITGVVLLLKYYFSFTFSMTLPHLEISPETSSAIGFYFYIAVLVLLLLGMDSCVRRRIHKPE